MSRNLLVLFLVCLIGSLAYGGIDTYVNFGGVGSVELQAVNDNSWAHFFGSGNFGAEVWITDVGQGMMDTDVLARAKSGFAVFYFEGWQNLFGYTNDQVWATAFVQGTGEAFMNLRYDNSMYIVQLERHDNKAGPFLYASGEYSIGYGMSIYDPDDRKFTAGVNVALSGGGWGAFAPGQWFPVATGSYGWGDYDSVFSPIPPGYYHPVNYASAGGQGNFQMNLYGEHYLKFNGGTIELPGGGAFHLDVEFFDGMNFAWYDTIVR